jgi:hypothetical protein
MGENGSRRPALRKAMACMRREKAMPEAKQAKSLFKK